jgi:hypothetical protein
MPLASMSSGDDFLWRPVLNGLMRAESLKDGSVDLYDIAEANEALDVREENIRRERGG